MHIPHLKGWKLEVNCHVLYWEKSIKLMWNFSAWDISPFSPSNVFIQLFIVVGSHWLFYILWVIMQYNIVYFLKTVYALAIGSPCTWFLYHFDITSLLWIFFSISLFYDITRHSRFIFYSPCPSPRISYFPRSPSSLSWGIILDNKHTLSPRQSSFLGPLSWKKKKIHET